MVLVVALSIGTAAHAAQAPARPARDGAVASQGSGRVRGRVLAADTAQPLPRAQVTLSGPSLQPPRRTLTDAEGGYEFADVPPGTFSVAATKTGYVNLQYGQRRPFQPGTSITVAAGQTVERIDIGLPRGAVIVARVADDLGFQMAGVQVRAERSQYRADGRRTLVGIYGPGPSQTDDRGEIRLFGLMPGEYVVSAIVAGLAVNSGATNEGYAPTYYPGVISPTQATAISVVLGQETAVQFALVRSRLARISGTVVGTEGRPVNGARVWLQSGTPNATLGANTDVDGRFTIETVAPGEYAVMVVRGAVEAIATTLTVDGSDIADLRLVAGPGTTVSGRLVFDGGPPPAGLDSQFRVRLASIDQPAVSGVILPQRTAPVDADGRFGLTGIAGPVVLDVISPEVWGVKSIEIGGENVSNLPVDPGRRLELSDVVITMTNRLTTLSGRVGDVQGQPASESVVVIVPMEPYHPSILSARVRVVRPGADGTFTTRGIVPGRYVALAVDALEEGRQFSPEFQQQVRRLGQEFTLGEGEARALMLRLTPGL